LAIDAQAGIRGCVDALPEIELAPGTLFIGDLHLDATREAASATFRDWLERGARGAPRLVVLGDLFDAWVGPAHARLDGARVVIEALHAFTRRGAALEIVHGNRDFLLDASFERSTGARVLASGFVGRLPSGERLLAVHGDELCTRDLAYQRMKRVVRSRPARWLAPRLPDGVALWAARRMRRASQSAIAMKPDEEKAQQESAARALALAAGASVLVCGHAHRFRDVALAGGPRWIVLDAFGDAQDVVEVGSDGRLMAQSSRANTAP
jgi:UDP-2,3-diacylglucosamine hydrolase